MFIIHQSILYEFLSNLIGSLLPYYDFILHWFTFYGTFKLLILHGFTFFGRFDWFVSSSWPTAVLQVDAFQLTLLAVCCIWWVQIKKFVHTVAETVLKFLLHLSSFVYVFKLHWFSSYFQGVHQLAHATWVSTGRQSRVGQSFAVELQDFMKANAWEACAMIKIYGLVSIWWDLDLLRVGPVQ